MNNFIVACDLHFYNNPSRSVMLPNGRTSWLQTQLDVVESILKYADKNDAEAVFINGDIFEEKTRIPTQVYNAVWSLFESYSFMDIYFNVGNHDVLFRTKESSLKPFSSIGHVITQPTYINNITVVPYGKETDDVLTPRPRMLANSPILITHADLSDLVYGPYDYEPKSDSKWDATKILSKGWEYIFNGHIHKPQDYKRLINVGSVMQHGFGEVGERKRFIHCLDSMDVRSVLTDAPTFHTFDRLTEDNILEALSNNKNYYRFDVSSDEVHNDIFNNYNIEYRITRTIKREKRLKSGSTKDEMKSYVELKNENLNKKKLFLIGEELLNAN